MRREITMPQLGMTQDSGVIVSWGKKPGDTVKADDILMEVETDKSTMEVEVGHDGILAELRAEAGAAVPVGDVVAVISDSADDVVTEVAGPKTEPGSAATEAPSLETAPHGEPRAARETPASRPTETPRNETLRQDARNVPNPVAPTTADGDGRLLASPKAKIEAHRRGVDLALLAKRGVPQPFHVADLENLAPEPRAGGGTLSALAATVERTAFESFCEWAADATDGVATSAAIWSAFASAAWRPGAGLAADEPFTARVETLVPVPSATTFKVAGGSGLSEVVPLDDIAEADLVILDLAGSGLADYRSGGSMVPTLTVAEDGDMLRITLGFDEAVMPVAKAAAVLAGLAGRVREPLRHCL